MISGDLRQRPYTGRGEEAVKDIKDIKELIGYVIEKLENDGIANVYAVFSDLPNALVVAEEDRYKVMLWKDGVKLRVTLKKETLEPTAVTLEA